MGGRKRLTFDYVQQQFELENYQLLTTNYIRSKDKLNYICPNRHKHSMSYNNWARGHRCPDCAHKKLSESKRKNFNEVKKAFKDAGYLILTKHYIRSSQKLTYLCPNGHTHEISWGSFKQGHRCPYCINRGKPTIEFIKSEFLKENYQLLTQEYKNNRQLLSYICPNGHNYFVKWNKWQQGRRCPYCSGKIKKTIEYIKSEFEKEEYQLLTSEYKNNNEKLDYICPESHKHSISWNNFRAGWRCPFCYSAKISELNRKRWADPTFQKKMQKALHRKPNKPEKFLTNLLNQLFPNEYKYVGDFQFFLGGKNPDFLNVDHQRKLIEIFGEYFHSPKITGLSKKVHENARVAHFKQFGFSTLIIWENELKNQDTLVSKLQEFHLQQEH